MPRVERHRQPRNLAGVQYVPIESLDVSEYHEQPDGKGTATQVHMTVNLQGLEDIPLVMRFKSHETISHLIRGAHSP